MSVGGGMKADELKTLGDEYGRGWQAHLARKLPSIVPGKHVNSRTVRRWLSGKSKIHPELAKRIRQILKPKRKKGLNP